MDLESIRAANRERNTAIVQAAVNADIEPGEDAPHKRISAALFVVADQWRARGEELKRLKRKGHVGTKASLDFGAEQLEDVAGSLVNDGADWVRAASEAAGVAVSLVKDGTTEAVTAALAPEGMEFGWEPCSARLDEYGDDRDIRCALPLGHEGDHADAPGWPVSIEARWEPCGELSPGDSRCVRGAGHAGYHVDADSNRFDTPTEGAAGQCPATINLRAERDGHLTTYCQLRAGHEGSHSDGNGEWVDDVMGHSVNPNNYEPNTIELFASQCASESTGERCMLPGDHTGTHIGRKGGKWPQTAAERVVEIKAEMGDIMAEIRGDAPIKVMARPCEACDTDTHRCKGCGVPTTHEQGFDCGSHDVLAGDGLKFIVGNGAYAARIIADAGSVPLLPAIPGQRAEAEAMTNAHGGVDVEFRTYLDSGRAMTVPVRATLTGAAAEAVNQGMLGSFSLGPILPPVEEYMTAPAIPFTAPETGFPQFPGGVMITGANSSRLPLGFDLSAMHIDLGTVPGLPRDRQSVSSIETMGDCGLKYRFQYRDKLPEVPAWWNVGGTAFHSYAEWVEKLLFGAPHGTAVNMLDSLAASVSGKFEQLFSDEQEKMTDESGVSPEQWRTAAKGKEGRDWWIDNGTTMAANYLVNRVGWGRAHTLAMLPDGSPAVEVGFAHNFGGVTLKGFIDQVWLRDTRTLGMYAQPVLVPRDLKAGARKPGSTFQLGVYDHAAREILGVPSGVKTESAYYMARKSEDLEVGDAGKAWPLASIAYRAQTTAAADAADNFIARPSEFCGSCAFRTACPIMNGGSAE